jgi:hypothetical protein
MDVHEAPAFGGLSPADQAYADRLSGQAAAAAQAGPMDVHEAPAFGGLSPADQAYADRLSGQVTIPAQIGPLDAHEAPAFSASEAASTGPMDRWEAGGSGGTLATSEAPSGVDDETGRPMGRGPLE